jgi:hypothetical protein
MRMQLWPSTKFWYDVSILGLTLLPYSFLIFICEFAELKNVFAKKLWLPISIIINIINIYSGFFLKAPDVIINENGEAAFVYQYSWPVIILFAVCSATILNMLYYLFKFSKKNIMAKKQFTPIILGIMLLFLGHIAILSPLFRGFPTDILVGILNAFCMFYALYKRNLFQLRLIASRGTCYAISAGISFAVFFNLVKPLEISIQKNYAMSTDKIILIIAFVFTLCTSIIYYIMKRFIDMIFIW